MVRAFRAWLAFAATCVVIVVLAPVGNASAASLKLKAPSKISASKHFRVRARGHGTHTQNYLALFFTLNASCPGTYAAASAAPQTILVDSRYVGKNFKVKLKSVHGGSPGTGRFCGYLYPKASGTAWAYESPEAAAHSKITFT